MSHKHGKAAPKPPTLITLTLPDESSLIRTGTLLIRRGALAVLRQFTYGDLAGLSQAIQEAAAQLLAVENDPPPDLPDKPAQPVEADAAPTEIVQEADAARTKTASPETPEAAAPTPGVLTAPPSEAHTPVNLSLF